MSAAIVGLELRFRARAVASAALGLVALTALVGSLYPSLGDSIADVEIPKEIGDFIGGGDHRYKGAGHTFEGATWQRSRAGSAPRSWRCTDRSSSP